MSAARTYRPSTTPYVRVNRETNRLRYLLSSNGALELDPAMARLVAAALLRAAKRLDPKGTARPPWSAP